MLQNNLSLKGKRIYMGSTYVCSDLHGNYDRYMEFLVSVNFSDDDMLFIIGDVLNRGGEAIELLQDIMQKENNVILIKGNHEHMLLDSLEELSHTRDKSQQLEIIRYECRVSQIGQEETLKQFSKLNQKQQYKIIDYLKSLPLYMEISVNNQSYLLVHAGLPDFSTSSLEYYDEQELLFGEHNYYEKHIENTIVIVGHRPTRFIQGAEPDLIYRQGDSINVDCGLGFGGQLGVLCLDTNEEFYI